MNKISKVLLPSIYIGVIGIMIVSVFLVIGGIKNYLHEEPKYDYSLKDVFEDEIVPVSKTQNDLISKPYISDKVKIHKEFYDYKSTQDKQINSLIYFENTYLQNTGVDYSGEEDFEIVSIFDGEVISVEDNNIYGKIVKIKHNDDLISIYSNIKDVLVTTGYNVTKGEIIATSNKSKIDTKVNSLLHFELMFKNKQINPETLYNNSINSIK